MGLKYFLADNFYIWGRQKINKWIFFLPNQHYRMHDCIPNGYIILSEDAQPALYIL